MSSTTIVGNEVENYIFSKVPVKYTQPSVERGYFKFRGIVHIHDYVISFVLLCNLGIRS